MDKELTAPEPQAVALSVDLLRMADYFSSLLEKPNWRPLRADVEDMRNHLRKAAAALAPDRAPQGFVLMPLEPTHDMLNAGIRTFPKLPYHDQHRRLYAAYLAASPQAPGTTEER